MNEVGGPRVAHDDLRDFVKVLDKAGELKRIKEEVDPILEISEITDRVCKTGKANKGKSSYLTGGPALLFEKIKGYPGSRVLMNQFGSERRMKLALNVDSLDEISGRIREFMEVKSPEGMLQKLKMLPMLAEVGKFFPRMIAREMPAARKSSAGENFSVLDFPVLQCWPGDGGRFITLPA
jgi:4-hydroxy-3-polyprenylbenzoate decarboxylase